MVNAAVAHTPVFLADTQGKIEQISDLFVPNPSQNSVLLEMRKLLDAPSSGRPVNLGQVIGQGGEGAVYEITTHPGLVAKIYHKPLEAERAAKIRAMASMSNDGLTKLTSCARGAS